MAICLVIRHGHSEGNAAGVLSGRAPGVHLSDTGASQVATLADQLASLPVVQVVSSPLERCVATAAAIATPHHLDVITDDALVECGYGEWTGRSLTELAKEPLWSQVQQDPESVTFPASPEFANESLTHMSQRVVTALMTRDAEIEKEFGTSAVWIAVSHGDLIKAAVAHAVGTPFGQFQRIVVLPASVAAVQRSADQTFLLGLNADPTSLVTLLATASAASGTATVGGSTGNTSETADDHG